MFPGGGEMLGPPGDPRYGANIAPVEKCNARKEKFILFSGS